MPLGPLPFLVGLVVPDRHPQTRRCLGDLEGDKFGAAEGTGEAERQQRAILLAYERALENWLRRIAPVSLPYPARYPEPC